MNITDAFLLPKDVILAPVKSLPEEKRHGFDADEDDFVVTRMRGRDQSKVIDGDMAMLVEQFKGGKTIVDAVLNFCNESGHDPEITLDAAYPVLEKLIQGKFLAVLGSEEAEAVEACLTKGEEWAGFKIVRSIQILEDSEIYQAKSKEGKTVALKLARSEAVDRLVKMFAREARILEYLRGNGAPQLLFHGDHEGRPFLVIEWCDGVNASRAATRLRSIYSKGGRRQLLSLCCAIADAYATLHDQGVIHGDVHPGNLIVDDHKEITIIDFGFARIVSGDESELSQSPRGGFGFFYDPEFASSTLRDKRKVPQTTFRSEQHILAHLLYRLICGHDYTEFSAEKKESMKQLAASEPEPFSHWEVDPWPDVEEILRRGLSREPGHRFATVRSFADALCSATIPDPPRRQLKSPVSVPVPFSDRLLVDYLQRFDPGEGLFESGLPEPPYSSINFGSAGVAYFLYRMACIRGDAELLSSAKLWIEKAISEAGSKGELAFTNDAGRITRDTIGSIALYHTETGLFATKALIGHAMGDIPSQYDGINRFVIAAQNPCENIDVTLGNSGVLLGCALLNEAMPGMDGIRPLGDALLNNVWNTLSAMPSVAEEGKFRFTGIAHGWSGVLYAVLMWCRSTGTPLPIGMVDRLEQLADLAEPARYGLQWQRKIRSQQFRDPSEYNTSWCNGTGGMIHLWTLAHAMAGNPRYLEMAEGAAWNVISGTDRINQICCGRPGQVYGVLNLYKHTNDNRWLEHARQMVHETSHSVIAPSGGQVPAFYYCLYKGPVGLALLLADVEAPREACMPLFESEGWFILPGSN